MQEPKTSSAGLDWAAEEHALCILEEASGRLLMERRFTHQEGGLAKLCRTLRDMGVKRLAIERPEGVLVERLLECGIVVTYPTKYKRPRAAFPRSALRGLRATFRGNESLARGHRIPHWLLSQRTAQGREIYRS